MFRYLTEFFSRKTSFQQSKEPASPAKQPVCYLLIKESARMQALDIMSYLTGGEDSRLQLTYQRYPEDFGFGGQRQLFSRYRCYNSIKDLIYFERSFIGGNPHPQGNYILRFGFDQTIILLLIKSRRFHLGIIDAVNLKDLLNVYNFDEILLPWDSPPPPIPSERIEIIKNPDFSPTLPKDVSEKTAPSALCKC